MYYQGKRQKRTTYTHEVFKSSFFLFYSIKLAERGVDMGREEYQIITNNPLVCEKLKDTHCVVYKEISYEGILREVRDLVHEGHLLLSHPLSGSVKPNETPYKSIMVAKETGEVDERSLKIIENAIDACGKFEFKSDRYPEAVLGDFRLIDWTLLESGIASADA